MSSILALRDVHVRYDGDDGRRLSALEGIDLPVPHGSFTVIIGESGSGKTTLLRALTGTLDPHTTSVRGTAQYGEIDLFTLDEPAFRALRGRDFGYVPQDALLGLNPLERVGFQATEPLRAHGIGEEDQWLPRVLDYFERVGIADSERVARSYPHELSGGMLQRVLIAAALAAEPKVLIADEPTTALDVTVQQRILDLLSHLNQQLGLTILLVTHDLGVAAERASHIAVLEHGRLREHGPRDAVLGSPRHAYTRQLIADSRYGGGLADADSAAAAPVLTARGVSKRFAAAHRREGVLALDDVGFTLGRARTLGIVGESGSGKTTLARIVGGLEQADAGSIRFHDQDLVARPVPSAVYRRLQFVYQSPYASLDPRMTVAQILREPLIGHRVVARPRVRQRVLELLDLVRLPAAVAPSLASELSGGQRQRVAIARALAVEPELVILDEPVSALDVSVRNGVLDLLRELQQRLGLSYLFISHDLGIVHEVAHDVLVLRRGRVQEQGRTREVYARPASAYTAELLAAVPAGPGFAGAAVGTVGAAGAGGIHDDRRRSTAAAHRDKEQTR